MRITYTLSSRHEKNQDDVETYMDANLEEGESVDGSREQDSLYGNEIEANKETNSGACKTTMDKDINSEPGPGRADKSVDSKNQVDSETEIPKSNSESMKVVQAKLKK